MSKLLRKFLNEKKKETIDRVISMYYDSTKTLNENVKEFSKKGIRIGGKTIGRNTIKKWCDENGIVSKVVGHFYTDEQIGKYFDVSKTIKENVAMFIRIGMPLSETRLRDYCKRNGILTFRGTRQFDYTKIASLYDESKSVYENREILKEKGIKVSVDKLAGYCKNNNINPWGALPIVEEENEIDSMFDYIKKKETNEVALQQSIFRMVRNKTSV